MADKFTTTTGADARLEAAADGIARLLGRDTTDEDWDLAHAALMSACNVELHRQGAAMNNLHQDLLEVLERHSIGWSLSEVMDALDTAGAFEKTWAEGDDD
ncbi:hypothetical protein [Brachybacterium sacelli]|uniref:Uncharacterized protein n=1 Tax=Brachybacterium sacelli TaxID=173364 RepID=A0ABS4X616_9MICO|nr:hypothetical protein [Brachybacterium sacelli]MBP2383771.1 hypothetical protein [Brachybacterium sacelli]